jgi:hypothetical protein
VIIGRTISQMFSREFKPGEAYTKELKSPRTGYEGPEQEKIYNNTVFFFKLGSR